MLPPLPEADRRRIVRWWAAMIDDATIARRLGVPSYTVSRTRRRLGLPSWYAPRLGLPHSPASRAKLSAGVRRRLDAAGVRSICQLATAPRGERQRRALAQSYGLPPELYPTQVRILIALTGGPLSLSELVDATGRQCRRQFAYAFRYKRVPGHCYLTDLSRRGLIVRLRTSRGVGNGSGAGPGLYSLTPLAMEMLAQAKEDPHAHPEP